MAAEITTGGSARLAILDLESDVMKEGLLSGLIRGWRLSDVVRALKITHADLIFSTGANKAHSEWLFVDWIPWQAVTAFTTSTAIRNSNFCIRYMGPFY